MAKLIIYYAHPGVQYSRVNTALNLAASAIHDITFVDLYAEYPRFNINVDREQHRLLQHDVIIFQHPLFWYSTPALIKEWTDLVLQYGFAYGEGGDRLSGKIMMNVISAGGPEEAYSPGGYQGYPLRTFLTPLERTAHLCQMKYSAPFVLYSALKAEKGEISNHSKSYAQLLGSIRDNTFNFEKAIQADVIQASDLNNFFLPKAGK